MSQLALFKQEAYTDRIPCHWGNEWCHDCGWCEGGLLLAAAKIEEQ